MNNPAADPQLYVASRRVLLDALEVLASHVNSLVLVGAQAVYLRTSATALPVAPYTSDGDLVIDPGSLAAHPQLQTAMTAGGFHLPQDKPSPGSWVKGTAMAGGTVEVPVDLLVPEAVAPGSGRRSVSLDGHDRLASRRVPGLEGALIDWDAMDVAALEDVDRRRFTVRVAGPAALLIAKAYKIADRLAQPGADRSDDKDAVDVYRLMLGTRVHDVAQRLETCRYSEVSRDVTVEGVTKLRELFDRRGAPGIRMAIRGLDPLVPSERVVEVARMFLRDLPE